MNTSRDRSALIFRKLSRQVVKLSRTPKPEYVHKFRTLSRRVEALMEGLILHPVGNDKKLLALLARLRKKAGKVRDLDVQISTLRNLRVPHDRIRKQDVIHGLCDERQEREARLVSAFNDKTLRELGRRINRAAKAIPAGSDPLEPALKQLQALTREPAPISEATLHRYRILGKRVRYLAEQCSDNPQASDIILQLKQVQDAIGEWHDWLKLTEKTTSFLAGDPSSGLLTTLRAITRNKFAQAVDHLARARNELSSPKPSRKPAGSAKTTKARSAIA